MTFSKVVKNLLVVEYKIIDENVDPKILYTPRKGYYLIEFNNNQGVAKGIYKILNWWILRFDLRHAFRSNCASDFASNCATLI